MGDWESYAVTHVRYWDDEDDRLKHVKRRGIDVEDGRVGEPEVARRRSVVFDLRSGDDHVTAVEDDGTLKLRQTVSVVKSGDGKGLRVNGERAEDDLGGLPTF